MKKYLIAMLFPIFAMLGGCTEREMTITSEPPNALVFVSDVEIGRTPVTITFTKYGDYDVILRRDGYKTLKTNAKIKPPWYAIPPFDLASELAMWTYHDRRFFHYKLQKQTLPSDEELIRNAEKLKRRNNSGSN